MSLIRYLGRTDAWLYFSLGFLPGLGTYLISDQPFTARMAGGTFVICLASGISSLKAFRSQSKNKEPIT